MGLLDDAGRREQQDRDRALHNHQAHRSVEPAQWIEDGIVLCLDCADEIASERLAAKPNAARCIECQQLHELKDCC